MKVKYLGKCINGVIDHIMQLDRIQVVALL
jgi:hypothetical protein